MKPQEIAKKYLQLARQYPGAELDTAFIDRLKARPQEWAASTHDRDLFEAWMDQNMAKYNTLSPLIRCINVVDNDPCPPWEFVYSDRMHYGNGVEKPSDAVPEDGCNCWPVCRANNPDCVCVQKQVEWTDDGKKFLYVPDDDGEGLVQTTEPFPIFECTSGCRCTEDCINRVSSSYGKV